MNPVLPILRKYSLPGAIEEYQITTPIGNAVVDYHLNSGLPLLFFHSTIKMTFQRQMKYILLDVEHRFFAA